jgi:quercetin dioxygenase-like cupin family protein
MHLANISTLERLNLSPDIEPPLGKWINGRVIAVIATPEEGSAEHLAVGASVVPPGTSTPVHSHPAEEMALIIAGSGVIEINGEPISVGVGDVVRTPPNVPHRTIAGDDASLIVYWVYAPAGSERRWLNPNTKEIA